MHAPSHAAPRPRLLLAAILAIILTVAAAAAVRFGALHALVAAMHYHGHHLIQHAAAMHYFG